MEGGNRKVTKNLKRGSNEVGIENNKLEREEWEGRERNRKELS
jgi:hypothetical protein